MSKKNVPTQEQIEILRSAKLAIRDLGVVGIRAFAGTGKTSMLQLIIEDSPTVNFLYIAFNDSSAKSFSERNILGKVNSKTINAFAIGYIKPQNIKDKDYRATEIAQLINCSIKDASLVKTFIGEYMNSNSNSMEEIKGDNNSNTIELSMRFFRMMTNNEIAQTHSAYLKSFELGVNSGEITIDTYGCVLLDEAQDSNPVTLSIFNAIKAAKVFVGDSHQGIYGFRGAVNAMELLQADHNHLLSVNFRSSDEIIKQANKIICGIKSESNEIVGGRKVISGGTVAKIARQNATLITLIKEEEGEFRLTRPIESIFAGVLAIYHWDCMEDEKIPSSYSFLKRFKKRSDIDAYILESGDRELASAIKIIEKEKEVGGDIYAIYESAKKRLNKNANLTLTTAHSSKGLEFNRVTLMNDFIKLPELLEKVISSGEGKAKFIEEVNLYYVAVTRAKDELIDLTYNACILNDERWLSSIKEKVKML
jgi:F-box protein, helicase, 18